MPFFMSEEQVPVLNLNIYISFLTTEQFVLIRKMRGQDVSRRLTDVHLPRGSIQSPNGSCLNDTATLERENEDLKVIWIM